MPETNYDILKSYRDEQEVTPERITEYCEEVIDLLKRDFGIKDLSNSELFDIRRNVEFVLRKNYELASDFNEANAKQKIDVVNWNIMRYPVDEVVGMFLNRYGLSLYGELKLEPGKEQEAYLKYLKGQLEIAREKAFNPLDTAD